MHINLAIWLVSLFAAQEAVAVYCVPTLVAFVRRLPNRGRIAFRNLAFGWTVVFWVWALYKATRTSAQAGEPAGEHETDRLADVDLTDRSVGDH